MLNCGARLSVAKLPYAAPWLATWDGTTIERVWGMHPGSWPRQSKRRLSEHRVLPPFSSRPRVVTRGMHQCHFWAALPHPQSVLPWCRPPLTPSIFPCSSSPPSSAPELKPRHLPRELGCGTLPCTSEAPHCNLSSSSCHATEVRHWAPPGRSPMPLV
jgi:hypothetical protein